MKSEIKNLLPRPSRKFFNVGAVENDAVDVMLYGVIGWEVDADDLVSQLKATNAKQINLSINSVGGDVFDGTAIYNALKAHPAKKVVSIDGIAASAASLIAMAGDEITIGKNAYLMIHRASAMAFGTSDDMRKTGGMLDKVDQAIAGTYADQTGKPVAEISAMMEAETWMVGQEAVDAGFCDSVNDFAGEQDEDDEDDDSVGNKLLGAYAHRPAGLRVAAMGGRKPPEKTPPPPTPAPKPAERKPMNSVEQIRAQAKANWAAQAEECQGFTDEDLYVRAMVREAKVTAEASAKPDVHASMTKLEEGWRERFRAENFDRGAWLSEEIYIRSMRRDQAASDREKGISRY